MTALFDLLRWLLQASAKASLAIVLIAVAERLARRRLRARWRYALWLLVVLRLLSPVAPPAAWSIFNWIPIHPAIELQLRGAAGQLLFDRADSAPIVPWWIAHWQLLAAIWIAGLLVVAARALVATVRVRRAIARATPSACGAAVAEELRARLGIRRSVSVVESPLAATPALHGVVRPVLLLPAGLCDTLGPGELRHVILHELSHLRRHDVAVNWLLTAVAAMHWFNPLVRFAVARIEEERELACDELTLSCLPEHERLGYGRTIIKLLERFRTPAAVPALVGIVNQKATMKRRLTVIRDGGGRPRLALPLLVTLSAVALLTLTDARGGARIGAATLDASAWRTLGRMDRRVSVDITNASLGELLGAVAAKSGLTVTQSPAIASSPVQRARFTVHAADVPARALLTRELLPFGVIAAPAADAITLTNAPPCLIRRHR